MNPLRVSRRTTRNLDAIVVNEMEAVQFTLTDVESKWADTNVEYKMKHAGKTEKIESKIVIKLTKKFAKEKNKTNYGDT